MTTELPDRWLTHEEKMTLCEAIDAYGWKHSWHLPQDRNGYTNWDSSETLAKCREVLQKYRRDAVRFAALCDKLDERIESIEAAIVKFDAECDAVNAEADAIALAEEASEMMEGPQPIDWPPVDDPPASR